MIDSYIPHSLEAYKSYKSEYKFPGSRFSLNEEFIRVGY
jgi:hypothetical protein